MSMASMSTITIMIIERDQRAYAVSSGHVSCYLHGWLVVAIALLLVATPTWADPPPADANQICPVTTDEPAKARFAIEHEGQMIYPCCGRCARRFRADPDRYVAVLATLENDASARNHEHDHAEDEHHDHVHDEMPTLIHWLGHFHPAMTHFPVGLLIAAAAAELIGLIARRLWFLDAARFCVWAGAIGVVIAAPLGWFNAGWTLEHDDVLMASHRWLGTLMFFWAIALVVLVEVSRRQSNSQWPYGYWVALFGGAVLVGVTGHLGGAIVFGPDYYEWPS